MVAVLLTLAGGTAWAADVSISVTGAPTTAKLGETKEFKINVSATGALNITEDNIPNPGTVTVNLLYTAGDGSGGPDTSSLFSAPTTVEGGCQFFTSGPKQGQCKDTQPVSGGPYALGASVFVPAALTPGLYTITVSASATNGLKLGTMPSFELYVEPAGSAPSVSIINPANGSSDFLVNQPTDAAVLITSALPLDSVTATLNGDPVSLSFDNDSGNWVGSMTLTLPGSNTFYVQACNSVGCGDDTSVFTVHYSFGSWLPPITTAKFQSGRTLPVKFRIGDYNGPTGDAVATVKLDGVPVGTAEVMYDSTGTPYYQLNVVLSVAAGAHNIGVYLNDGFTSVVYPITVK
jgi:hypothetical protein